MTQVEALLEGDEIADQVRQSNGVRATAAADHAPTAGPSTARTR